MVVVESSGGMGMCMRKWGGGCNLGGWKFSFIRVLRTSGGYGRPVADGRPVPGRKSGTG